MNSRVVGIIKFESPRPNGQGGDLGLSFSAGDEGLTLESWLVGLVGESIQRDASAPRWENRRNAVPSTRRVRANLEQLAAELDREYLELAAT
ncbi:MAG: hypothetical protein ACKVP0_13695 [Pirellulaceae bacterium]